MVSQHALHACVELSEASRFQTLHAHRDEDRTECLV